MNRVPHLRRGFIAARVGFGRLILRVILPKGGLHFCLSFRSTPGSPTSVLARWGGKGICFCSLRCHPERSLARQRQTQSKDLLLSVLRRERGL